jgi:hypothetical protein
LIIDIKCRICGEPWDNDELHYVDGKTYTEAAAEFRAVGCEVFETNHSGRRADPGIGVITDLLGDDMDGLASMIEDFDL